MDSVLRQARASVEPATSWQRPYAGPGARGRSSSAGPRLILEPLRTTPPLESTAGFTARAPLQPTPLLESTAKATAGGEEPQHPTAPQRPPEPPAPRPASLGRRPGATSPGAYPAAPSCRDADAVVAPRAPPLPRSARPPVPSIRSAVVSTAEDGSGQPMPTVTAADDADAELDGLGAEEVQLLQELQNLEAELCEKQATMKDIAASSALLRDEFAASRAEARQLSLEVAELELGLSQTGEDSAEEGEEGESADSSEPSQLRLVAPADPSVSDERLRARQAMGLAG